MPGYDDLGEILEWERLSSNYYEPFRTPYSVLPMRSDKIRVHVRSCFGPDAFDTLLDQRPLSLCLLLCIQLQLHFLF